MSAERPESTQDEPVVFVVIPTFNEAAAIRQTVEPLLKMPVTVVVVDDASDDRTDERLAGLGLHYLCHPVNLGQGAALQTGTSYALGRSVLTDIVVAAAAGNGRVVTVGDVVLSTSHRGMIRTRIAAEATGNRRMHTRSRVVLTTGHDRVVGGGLIGAAAGYGAVLRWRRDRRRR